MRQRACGVTLLTCGLLLVLAAWYLTALDFRTGRTVYRRLAGTGFAFNNNYAPVTLGPDGTAYVGVLGGVVALP